MHRHQDRVCAIQTLPTCQSPLDITVAVTREISRATGIPADVLGDVFGRHNPDAAKSYSVAQRMSWASSRKTSRTEDLACCLLGLFGVNIPLIYREGAAAFQRLQHEILARRRDESIFAWDLGCTGHLSEQMLAPSPAHFALSRDVMRSPKSAAPAISRDGAQWQLTAPSSRPHRVLYRDSKADPGRYCSQNLILLVRLACCKRRNDGCPVSPCVIFLRQSICDHHERAVQPGYFDPLALDSSPGPGPLDEDCIVDPREWTSLQSPFTAVIHGSGVDVEACRQRQMNAWDMSADPVSCVCVSPSHTLAPAPKTALKSKRPPRSEPSCSALEILVLMLRREGAGAKRP